MRFYHSFEAECHDVHKFLSQTCRKPCDAVQPLLFESIQIIDLPSGPSRVQHNPIDIDIRTLFATRREAPSWSDFLLSLRSRAGPSMPVSTQLRLGCLNDVFLQMTNVRELRLAHVCLSKTMQEHIFQLLQLRRLICADVFIDSSDTDDADHSPDIHCLPLHYLKIGYGPSEYDATSLLRLVSYSSLEELRFNSFIDLSEEFYRGGSKFILPLPSTSPSFKYLIMILVRCGAVVTLQLSIPLFIPNVHFNSTWIDSEVLFDISDASLPDVVLELSRVLIWTMHMIIGARQRTFAFCPSILSP